MAATNFLSDSGPRELIILIFQGCQTPSDVLAFASACSYLRQVWLVSAPIIISYVWPREIPGFDHALIVTRITQLGIDEITRGELPSKDIQLAKLSVHARLPNIAELKNILRLNHFARILEAAFPHDTVILPNDRPHDEDDMLPEAPERMLEWRERVYTAIYRTLIIGAALVGLYSEPFSQARESDDPNLADLETAPYPSRKHLDYMIRFKVYQREIAQKDARFIFGDLAEWLISDIFSDKQARRTYAKRFEEGIGRAECCSSLKFRQEDDEPINDYQLRCPFSTFGTDGHSDSHFAVWQIMQMMWIFERIGWTVRHRYIYDADTTASPPPDSYLSTNFETFEKESIKVRLAFFGSFEFEEVHMPNKVDKIDRITATCYKTTPSNQSILSTGSGRDDNMSNIYIHETCSKTKHILQTIHEDYKRSIRSQEETENNGPPLNFRFFEYVLQHYFGVRLIDQTFPNEGNIIDTTFERFLELMGIFAHDDVDDRAAYGGGELQDGDFHDGTEILTSCEFPQDRYN